MASSEDLSYAFLEAHPVDAARVLERLAPASAAALLLSAPLRCAAPVLRQMLPLAGARCLESLDDDGTAGLLHGVGAQAGVALLRYFGAERRARLLARLPTGLNVAYQMLLGYPEGTVGAWMDPRPLTLPADMTAGESLERVRGADERVVGNLHVTDRNQRLLGYVELPELLRADPATSVARLLRTSAHRLPAQALLAGVRKNTGWNEASILPVVERGDRLVGVLTHAALLRALSAAQGATTLRGGDDTLAGIAGAYWFGVSSLIEAVVSLLPVENREGEA